MDSQTDIDPIGNDNAAAVIGEELKDWIEDTAFEESTRTCRLSPSDVIRAALRHYADEYEEQPERFDPKRNGTLHDKWCRE